jgi:pyruvate dehydrogenase E2 component (dihydrolipoamide acetyltransferase)
MRKAIAQSMTRSKREIPHYYLQLEASLQVARKWLDRVNAERAPEERLLMASLCVKALALALKRYPEFNGFYGKGGFEPSERINVGVAIAIRGGGLVAPAIVDSDRLPLSELMARLADLTRRTRAGQLRSSELSSPTITLSSLGDLGVDALFGVIYPPQVALIGIGRPALRPRAEGSAVISDLSAILTLSADHRVSDGHRGARLLAEIAKLLQKPERL